MAKKKIRFTNFWGDEISKRQYVDDKIRVFSEMELFSPDSIANEREQINKLHGMLLKVKGRGDTDLSGKLQKALLALSDLTRRCAE